MPDQAPFRQVDEKHVSAVLTKMLWSPKMDLIAVANIQGEVLLYRLQWQKVWSVAPPSEGEKVTSLAWRTDGKVLAIGYSGGKIHLCDVENSSNLHTLEVKGQVNSMTWMCESSGATCGESQQADKECFIDQSAKYLPRLLPFAKTYGSLTKGHSEESAEDAKKLKDQADLNILIVGCVDGLVHLYAYGIFPVASVDLTAQTTQDCKVVSGLLSHDLRLLTLVVEEGRSDQSEERKNSVKMISYDTALLASRHKELRILGLKFGQISTLIGYLESTIHQMCEAWEDILLEMDSKLMKFAETKAKQSSGTISNDFLELLMFGTPSDDLQGFLLHELTEKGLRKLGHSIETSYSNIQKLVLKHLQSVGQALMYHLSDLKGMALWYEKFGVLGLTPDLVSGAVSTAGSFMLKANELQQVIDGSMKNFKAFFRWLYVIIQRLSDEPIPAELSKMTQQDLNFVAQFLKDTFTEEDDDETGHKFKLERVGQYLKKEDLHDLADTSSNTWLQFLNSSSQLKESSLLYPSHPKKSLLQVHELLINSINTALTQPACVIGRSLQCISMVPILAVPSRKEEHAAVRFSQMSATSKDGCYLYTAFTEHSAPCDKCFITRQRTQCDSSTQGSVEAVGVYFKEIGSAELDDSSSSYRCGHHQILDLSFYDEETLSILLQEDTPDNAPVLVQVKLTSIEDDIYTTISINNKDLTDLTESESIRCVDLGASVDHMSFRKLENMKASSFAVSGTRKVACVLFSSRRRVRLFLMDVEDEDEDDEEEAEDEGETLDETAEDSKLSRDAETDGLMESGEDGADNDDEDKENTSHDSVGMDV